MLPWASISDFRILVVDMRLPSLAKIIGTTIMVTCDWLCSSLNLLSNSPLLRVSSLTTSALTSPSITAGPTSSSNFAISDVLFGNFSFSSNSNADYLIWKLFSSFFPFFSANSSDVRPIITFFDIENPFSSRAMCPAWIISKVPPSATRLNSIILINLF